MLASSVQAGRAVKIRVVIMLATFLSMSVASPADAGFIRARLLFNLKDARITESSGVASSAYTGKILFTHNDSGDTGRFFAIGPKGQTLATYDVAPVGAVDWEDMTSSTDYRKRPALLFGDIGDNYAPRPTRPAIAAYQVLEPKVDPSAAGVTDTLVPETVHVMVYEDGPHDAETMFFLPKERRIGIVTKDANGQSGVYVEDFEVLASEGDLTEIDPFVSILRRVATIRFDKIARPYQKGDYAPESRLQATGGEITRDGTRLVVRTYVEAFQWDISRGLVAGLKKAAVRIPLPRTKQGEAIAYYGDDRSLVTTTEQLPSPVHLVPAV
jgi:hypothetical protein